MKEIIKPVSNGLLFFACILIICLFPWGCNTAPPILGIPDGMDVFLIKESLLAQYSEGKFLLEFHLFNQEGGSRDAEIRFTIRSLLNRNSITVTENVSLKHGSTFHTTEIIAQDLDTGQIASRSDYIWFNIEYTVKTEEQKYSDLKSLYEAVRKFDLTVLGPDTWEAGSVIPVHVIAKENGWKANYRKTKEDNSSVSAILSSGEKNMVFSKVEKTDRNDEVLLHIPAPLEIGSYTLTITAEKTGSPLREEVSFPVTVCRDIKIYITTDKPIYQPGQDIHIRALALGVEKKPAAGLPAIITVYDGKGNKVFKKETTTTGYGLIHTTFSLASFVNKGFYKIEVVVEKAVEEKTIPVESYVLPKFRIDCVTDREFYKPGDLVRGSISAQYFFGKPIDGGEVLINTYSFDVEWKKESSFSGYTDDGGMFAFDIPVPAYLVGSQLEQGLGSLRLDIQVKDKTNHIRTIQEMIRIADSQVIIYLMPESRYFGSGMSIYFYMLTTDPLGRPLETENTVMAGNLSMTISTDEKGFVSFPMDIDKLPCDITVRSRTSNAQSAQKTFSFSGGIDVTGSYIFLRTDSPVYSEGDQIQYEVCTNLKINRLYLDVVKENKTLLTKTLKVKNNTVKGTLSVSPGMDGIVRLSAYAINEDSTIIRNTRLVYIDPADELALNVVPGRDVYLPGEEVDLSIHATDAKGNPCQAAVGLLVVDEAVYALQENRPGLERVYFEVEEAFRKPRYEIHGFSYSDIFLKQEKIDPTWAEVFLTTQTVDVPHGIEYAVTWKEAGAVKDILASRIEKECFYPVVKELYEKIYTKNGNMKHNENTLETQVKGIIDAKQISIYDLWKKPVLIRLDKTIFQIICTGWDMKNKTNDDMMYSFQINNLYTVYWDFIYQYDPPLEWNLEWDWDFLRDNRRMLIPEMAMEGAGNVEMALDEVKDEKGGPDIRVRKYFPETLFVEPALILDEKGRGTVTFPAADSITEWRVSSTASSLGGELGSNVSGFKVFQDFFIDIDFPVSLTQNDEVSVPIALYNYLPTSQGIALSVRMDSWFELLDRPEKTRILEPDEVSVEYFRIRVKGIGTHRFQVTAQGESMSDAIERSITIIPDGTEIPVSVSDRLNNTVEKILVIPQEAIEKSQGIILKIYPGLFSQVVEGLDSLFRLPSGCFEQTSSTTYPNVLALRYMQDAGIISPEIELKASSYINQGYQRLLTFECDGGGFEWFGNTPAHNILTSYGLMEFYDMSYVHPVDPAVIRRTQAYLVSKQKPDGSFPPDAGGIPEGAIDAFTGNILRNTAYICWALAYSGETSGAAGRAINYIKKNSNLSMDNFTLAVCAQALLTINSDDSTGQQILTELEKRKINDEQGCHWEQNQPTSMYGTEEIAVIETTALVAHAMLSGKAYQKTVLGAIDFLIRKKDAFGNWTSTQATIASLRTFIKSLAAVSKGASGSINISVNNRMLNPLFMDKADADVMRMIDISPFIKKGENNISITLTSREDASFLYQIAGSYYVPHSREENEEKELVSINVNYDKSSLHVDDMVEVTVKVKNNSINKNLNMMIVDIGVAPGFDVLIEDFNQALHGGALTKIEQAGRQLILYIEKITAKEELVYTYRMKARFPMKVASPQSRFYSYYGDEEATFLPPGIEVMER